MNHLSTLTLVLILLMTPYAHSKDTQGNADLQSGQAADRLHDGRDDFDFAMGSWAITNQRLMHRLANSNEWETFDAHLHVQRLPGKIGNFDEWVAEKWRPGFVGMALRVFNPTTNLWSIYWLTNVDGGLDGKSGQLTPPVVGKFQGDVGVFEGPDLFEGKPIRVRFVWTHLDADHAKWEQAFSADDGHTWEINWKMDMRKIEN